MRQPIIEALQKQVYAEQEQLLEIDRLFARQKKTEAFDSMRQTSLLIAREMQQIRVDQSRLAVDIAERQVESNFCFCLSERELGLFYELLDTFVFANPSIEGDVARKILEQIEPLAARINCLDCGHAFPQHSSSSANYQGCFKCSDDACQGFKFKPY